MYKIVLTEQAQTDYAHFVKSGQAHTVKKIAAILEDIAAHPYTGIGKPEALKYELSGMWSRRINAEHRIIYKVLESININNTDLWNCNPFKARYTKYEASG